MRSTVICALIALTGTAVSVEGGERVILQIFETEWDDIERRTPDIFLAGYGAAWLPPPSKASDAFSVGFDVFDRFNLGKPPLSDSTSDRARTAYGTEATFGAMVRELRRADIHVYIDAVLNHNSGRTTSDFFLAEGGWPGMWIPRESPPRDKLPTDDWGDFHAGNGSGYLQSENPGGGNYNLWRGDLVALVDLQQDRSNQFIRQPVDAGDPQNIPPGTVRNLPDPNNARFYPDRVLTPEIFVNPASNNSGNDVETQYPFNLNNEMQGDPIAEDSTGYLRRWLQWMLEVQQIDGYRLDASKHVFPFWWDTHFDSAVFRGRTAPDGSKVTPFSFGENTTGNFDILNNYYRKDLFANRDALDLSGAGKLRNLGSAGGFGTWADLFGDANSSHLDQADDGLQNGSAGVFHVFSHDNGSVGNGGSLPPLPTDRQQGWFAHAYMLMRPGVPIVYYNGRGVARTNGFFPREGTPVALGWNPNSGAADNVMTKLVGLHNSIATGDYFQRNGNISDVLIYERANNPGGGLIGNVLVAVNDRYDAGTDSFTINTTFPPGSRLVEYTGNAANPAVDPSGIIPDVLTVSGSGSVTLVVPRNVSSRGEHNRGYLVYAPAVPDATVTIVGQNGEVPADPVFFPDFLQRINAVPVITADTFTLRVETIPGDTVDLTTDDNSLFKIDDGAMDWNGNGAPDVPISDDSLSGFEEFTDVKNPGMLDPDREGLYEQVIDTTLLGEGFHYIRTVSFRQRPAGTGPLANEQRAVVYVDRLEPVIDLDGGDGQIVTEDQPTFKFLLGDTTPEVIYAFLNLDEGDDPLSMLTTPNAARRFDRLEWRKTFDDTLTPGENTITLVAAEPSGRQAVLEYTVFLQGSGCNIADIAEPFGVLDLTDINTFIGGFVGQQSEADIAAPFGVFDLADINAFIAAFTSGCP